MSIEQRPHLDGIHVLVIDDNEDARKVLEAYLIYVGAKVTTARSGGEALAMMSTGLPLNRKERFYTGTVLPMIVCRDSFRHFDRFCRLIPGCPPLDINGDPRAQIQFFSECNLAPTRSSVRSRPRRVGLRGVP